MSDKGNKMSYYMRRQNAESNMDRFYHASLTSSLFDNPGVERRWGRFGTYGHKRLDWFDDSQSADAALSKIVCEKIHRGYVLEGDS